MKKKKINLRLSSLFAIVFCLMSGLLISNPGTAQTVFDPHVNCVNGCTAKDIKNITAALVEPTAPYNILPASFSCTSGQNVSVKIAVFLQTNTQKAGIYVYANIRKTSDNSLLGTVSECFSTGALTTVGDITKVVFSQSLTWPCGLVIKLTDVYVAWGTGNTDFCEGSTDPRCPATTSKCFALAPGEYIPVIIPTSSGTTQTKCSTSPGGTTATFDLSESDATIKNGQTGVHVRWYSDAAGTTELTGTGKTAFVNSTNPQTVYAKVCNDPSPGTVCSGLQNVVLTVVPKPLTLVLTGSSICASAPNTGTVSSGSSESGISYQLKDGSNADVQSAKNGTGSGLTWTGLAVGTGYHVVSTGGGTTACPGSSNSVDVISVANPVALSLAGSSICASAPGTGTVSSTTSQSGVSYQLKDGSNADVQSAKNGTGSGLTWTGLAVGNGYHVVSTGGGTTACPGSSNNVNVTSVSNPSTPSVTYNPPACDATTFSVTITGVVNGATYTIKNKDGNNIAGVLPGNSVVAPNTNNIVFSNIPAGSGYQVTVQVGACTSTANSCGQPTPPTRIQTQTQPEIITEKQTTVKAYPNPFSDRVKFMVTSTVAGNGNLEVYNIMGQKIKTVYQGYIAKGTQSFELSLPKQNVGNLVYVLRVGDKKVTGKILQMNQ